MLCCCMTISWLSGYYLAVWCWCCCCFCYCYIVSLIAIATLTFFSIALSMLALQIWNCEIFTLSWNLLNMIRVDSCSSLLSSTQYFILFFSISIAARLSRHSIFYHSFVLPFSLSTSLYILAHLHTNTHTHKIIKPPAKPKSQHVHCSHFHEHPKWHFNVVWRAQFY